MRVRHGVLAAATVAALALPACSAGAPAHRSSAATTAHPSSAATTAPPPLQGRLRDGLLTRAQLPKGFRLQPMEAAPTTGAPDATATPVPIASMPCADLDDGYSMTDQVRPVEQVAVGLVREPEGKGDTYGWFGQEMLRRYAPGRAAEVMAGLHAVTRRCPSFTEANLDGTHWQVTVSVKGAAAPADDSLVVRVATPVPGYGGPDITETAFVREGDVILVVDKMDAVKPPSGTEAVLGPAVAAYQAAAARRNQA